MKKRYTLFTAIAVTSAVMLASAQQQPTNGNFEDWTNVGTETEEPNGWNGMMTGNLCTLCQLGDSQRVFRDATDVHGGTYSARIETTSALGNVVNGAMTTGKVTAPSTTPSQGYNITLSADANFNHPFTDMPDSLVVWAKYNITTNADSARVSVVLHDAYDLRDPQDGSSAPHVVATARKNFQTDGTTNWKRISVPFSYTGPSADPVAYALITFTSTYIAGAGSTTAKLWVDDLEFIYNPTNPTSVSEVTESVVVYPNPTMDGNVTIALGAEFGNGVATVYNMMGQTVGVVNIQNDNKLSLQIDQPAGMYFINVKSDNGDSSTVRVIKG